MNSRILFSTLLVMLLALAGCGQQGAEVPETETAAADTTAKASGEAPNNEAWEAMIAEIRAVETDEEKVPILKTFVKENPNNERTAYALSGVIYYLGEDPAAREDSLAFSNEALAAFEVGSANVSRNYVGIPEVPLYSYWGRTLAEAGQHEKAMEMLAADAVLGNDEEALDALHGAYVALKGEAGFEDYLKQTRKDLAKTIDDFTLNNYQGEPLTMSSLKGQVVLLSFWFPT